MDTAVQITQIRPDGIHPTDDGYQSIALEWIQSLNQAAQNGWLTKPESGNGECNDSTASVPTYTNAGYVTPSATPNKDGLIGASSSSGTAPTPHLGALFLFIMAAAVIG